MFGLLVSYAEKKTGVSLGYLRHIEAVSPRLFLKFSKIFSLANCQKKAPKDAMHVAGLTASLNDDCGECVQISLNLAKQDKVPAAVLNAVLSGRPSDLNPELRTVHEFTLACLRADTPSDELREKVRALYGDEALIELSIVIAASRFFPQVKRVLGYAKTCAMVRPSV